MGKLQQIIRILLCMKYICTVFIIRYSIINIGLIAYQLCYKYYYLNVIVLNTIKAFQQNIIILSIKFLWNEWMLTNFAKYLKDKFFYLSILGLSVREYFIVLTVAFNNTFFISPTFVKFYLLNVQYQTTHLVVYIGVT